MLDGKWGTPSRFDVKTKIYDVSLSYTTALVLFFFYQRSLAPNFSWVWESWNEAENSCDVCKISTSFPEKINTFFGLLLYMAQRQNYPSSDSKIFRIISYSCRILNYFFENRRTKFRISSYFLEIILEKLTLERKFFFSLPFPKMFDLMPFCNFLSSTMKGT